MKIKLSQEIQGSITPVAIFTSEADARRFAEKIAPHKVIWGLNEWDSHLGRYNGGCFTVCPFIENPVVQESV